MLSAWALVFFAVSIVCHLAWRAWHRFAIGDQDGDEPAERANVGPVGKASLAFWAVAAGVAWMWSIGRLLPFVETGPLWAGLAVAAGQVGWIAWAGRERSGANFAGERAPAVPSEPKRVVVEPAFGRWPLIDADTGERFNHMTWLEPALADRIEEWDDLFQLSFDPDDEHARSRFATPEQEARYRDEALAIKAALETAFGLGSVRFGPTWTEDRGDDAPSA